MDGRLGRSIANCKIRKIVPLVDLRCLGVKNLLDIIDLETFYT